MEAKAPAADTVRVAIVGSGLTGLTAAYLLTSTQSTPGKQMHVELFERGSMLGMDSQSITVHQSGKDVRIDVPMRAFSHGYYPELLKLYKSLHIPFKPMDLTFAFSVLDQELPADKREGCPPPSLLYGGLARGARLKFPRSKHSMLDFLFCSPRRLFSIVFSYLILVFLACFHTWLGHTHDDHHRLANTPFREWAQTAWISRYFLDDLLIPMMSFVMTTDAAAIAGIPTADMLHYIAHTFWSQHYTVRGGVQQVVHALSKPLPPEHIHLGASILDVVPESAGSVRTVALTGEKANGSKFCLGGFHHVVFTTQTPQSALMISQYLEHLRSNPTPTTIEQQDLQRCQGMVRQLRSLRYDQSTVLNHSDTTILPRDRSLWRDLNFLRQSHDAQTELPKETHTMATHIVWRAPAGSAPTSPDTIMQTTNPLQSFYPREECILSHSAFERFVLTLEGKRARNSFFTLAAQHKKTLGMQLGKLQGRFPAGAESDTTAGPGIWVSGSWTMGIPLLEGCVTSARLVSDSILSSHGLSTEHIRKIWA